MHRSLLRRPSVQTPVRQVRQTWDLSATVDVDTLLSQRKGRILASIPTAVPQSTVGCPGSAQLGSEHQHATPTDQSRRRIARRRRRLRYWRNSELATLRPPETWFAISVVRVPLYAERVTFGPAVMLGHRLPSEQMSPSPGARAVAGLPHGIL